jgi:hypothetical protein
MSKLQADFDKFDSANPEVYELFKKFTFDAIHAGYGRYSSDAILHRIRWHTNVETNSADGFKLNDHHTAYYARKFMLDFPEHCGFFRTRPLSHCR